MGQPASSAARRITFRAAACGCGPAGPGSSRPRLAQASPTGVEHVGAVHATAEADLQDLAADRALSEGEKGEGGQEVEGDELAALRGRGLHLNGGAEDARQAGPIAFRQRLPPA